jgi:hypothetical protein
MWNHYQYWFKSNKNFLQKMKKPSQNEMCKFITKQLNNPKISNKYYPNQKCYPSWRFLHHEHWN